MVGMGVVVAAGGGGCGVLVLSLPSYNVSL